MMTDAKGALKVNGSVVLDENGDGTITFAVQNAWQRWEVDSVRVSTSQAETQTPYPQAEAFVGPISPAFSQGATWTGNSDTFLGSAEVTPGDDLNIVFTGGVPGTTAYATVYGTRYTRTS